MTENDDIKPDDRDRQPEDISWLEEQRRWEQNEKARTMIESGDMGGSTKSLKLLSTPGLGGEYDGILRGAVGDTEDTRNKHLRHSRLDAEEEYPEIYPHHRLGMQKKGKRQIADDSQTYLTKEQFINLYSAVSFANEHGVALYARITIQWKLLGYTDHAEAAKQLQDGFFKPLAGWYKYNNKAEKGVKHIHELYWIYTHENSEKGGFHTHIIAGIPMELRKEFRAWVRDRVAALSKIKPACSGVVDIKCPPSNPIGRQWRAFQYLCKGLDPSATVEIPRHEDPVYLSGLIEPYYEAPGQITCKNRMGLSNNLKATARHKYFQFTSWMEKGIFDRRILYTSSQYDNWHTHNAAYAKFRSRNYTCQTSESLFSPPGK